MEVSVRQQQLMASVTFKDEKCQQHLEFLEIEKPVDLSSAATSSATTNTQTDLYNFRFYLLHLFAH